MDLYFQCCCHRTWSLFLNFCENRPLFSVTCVAAYLSAFYCMLRITTPYEMTAYSAHRDSVIGWRRWRHRDADQSKRRSMTTAVRKRRHSGRGEAWPVQPLHRQTARSRTSPSETILPRNFPPRWTLRPPHPALDLRAPYALVTLSCATAPAINN